MNVSGILVVVPVAKFDRAIEALDELPGVQVHHTDPATGRIIVTQEAESIREEVEGLKRIKALPHVILAEMVHHYFEEDTEMIESLPPELENEGLARVPPYLDD